MQTVAIESTVPGVPGWLRAAAVTGIAWNLYGVYQYVGTFTVSGRSAMTAGTAAAQAALTLSLPAWISAVFAVGVFGGLAGSVLLALRRDLARRAFAASSIGYGLLFAGDAGYGVFAAVPSQLGILAVVVTISAALTWTSQLAGRRGLLS